MRRGQASRVEALHPNEGSHLGRRVAYRCDRGLEPYDLGESHRAEMLEQRTVSGADLERALPVGQLGKLGAQRLGVARRSVARFAGSIEPRIGIGALEIPRGWHLRSVQEL